MDERDKEQMAREVHRVISIATEDFLRGQPMKNVITEKLLFLSDCDSDTLYTVTRNILETNNCSI